MRPFFMQYPRVYERHHQTRIIIQKPILLFPSSICAFVQGTSHAVHIRIFPMITIEIRLIHPTQTPLLIHLLDPPIVNAIVIIEKFVLERQIPLNTELKSDRSVHNGAYMDLWKEGN
jgi:hypothetical protein